jgi:phage terminase large subunit-like protein
MIQQIAYQDLKRLDLDARNSSNYRVVVEQEPGSGGKESALNTIRRTLPGFNAQAHPKRESKEADWHPWAAQVNLGGVEYLVAPWNEPLFREMESAPFGKFKDQLDCTAGGFKYIWLIPQARIL